MNSWRSSDKTSVQSVASQIVKSLHPKMKRCYFYAGGWLL